MTPTFDLEEEQLKKEVKKRNAKLVLIQLPGGLKPQGPRLAAIAEKAGARAIISADPCYGACDLATTEAKQLGADLIIHYGHSEMRQQNAYPTLYIEAKAEQSVKTAVMKALSHLTPWQKIGLVTTVQHAHKLEEARQILMNANKIVRIGDAGQLKHVGQVLGCDYSNARAVSREVDAFLFIGGGKFHALGVSLATAKPTIVADPYEQKAFPIEAEAKTILKKRYAAIHEARQAKNFGILIGLKPGQLQVEQALRLKTLIEQAGKIATLFALKEIIPDRLMQFPTVEAFINTACPRISLDATENFRKPLLTPNEARVALNVQRWEELCPTDLLEN